MNKRKLHHRLAELRAVPTLLLLGLALVFGATAVLALRANNQRMIELRDAVFAADEQDGDVEGALLALREHVHAHMNTNLTSGANAVRPPIQLKYTYERLVEAERAKLQVSNPGLYDQAISYCEGRFQGGHIVERAQCIQDYVQQRGGAQAEAGSVPDDLYKFDFASPSWSPDLAGWSLVLAVVFGILFIVRLGTEYLIKFELHR